MPTYISLYPYDHMIELKIIGMTGDGTLISGFLFFFYFFFYFLFFYFLFFLIFFFRVSCNIVS